MNKKKIMLDTIFNISASIAPIIFLQLIVYPLMSRKLDMATYGTAITIIGIAMLVIQVSGTGINNTRIIEEKKYKSNNFSGDFNLIALLIMVLNLAVTVIILHVVSISLFSIEGILIVLFIQLGFLNLYLTSEFNIKLQFNKVLVSNMCLIAGYLIGLLVFIYTNNWIFIFFIGMLFTVAYELLKTNFWKNDYKKTPLLRDTLNKVLIISFSSLMISLVTYADRVFLYPMLGSTMVAIYYTSSQFGKLISMGLSPISTIILSFISKKESMTVNSFWKFNIINFVFCSIFFFISLFLSEPVMSFLYPTMSNEIIEYMNIANLAAIIMGSSSIIQPIILKFCSTKWQLFIQVIHITFYFILGYTFIQKWGLIGFCYSSVITAVLRVVLLCIIGTITLKKNEKESV